MISDIKKLPKSQVELEIKVPGQEFNSFINQATLNLGKDLEMKGFRKGKVPKEIIEKEISPEKILMEAADLAVKENYEKSIRQLIEQDKIEPISQPEIEIKKLAKDNEFIFLAKISVLPEIKLPDYKKIAAKVERKETSIEEKEIEDALKWVQKSRAKFVVENQPAQKGDFVEIEYWLPLTSSEIKEAKSPAVQKDAFILGEGHFIPGFEEKIIGMRAEEEKENISLTLPENHPQKNLAGQNIVVKVKVKSVQKVELPEINDEFVKNLGNFENLAAFKKNIKEGLISEKDQAESQRVRNEILDRISREAESEIPEVLIKKEQNHFLENLKRQVSNNLKIPFEDYLKKIKKTEKEILDSFLPEAQKRVKSFLVLREIGQKEKIEASEEEIIKEADKALKRYPDPEKAKKELDLERLKEYTKEAVRTEKIFKLLENLR